MDGYRRKPGWIRLLTLACWLNTAFMPVQVMVVFGHPPAEAVAIWAKLTAQNKAVMALSPVAALGLQRVTAWGWWAALALAAAALFNNLILLGFPPPVRVGWVYLATAAVLAWGAWLLRPATYRLFREGSRHWWKTPRRYALAVPVEVEGGGGEPARWQTVDVSRTGVFLAAPGRSLRPGERVTLRIGFRERWIRCLASVVRHAEGCANRPEGFGLRFEELGLADRVWLRLRLGAVV